MLIGLHGRKQAGKDTTFERIRALYGFDSLAAQRVERVGFADMLYKSAAASLGVTVEQLQRWKTERVFVTVRSGPYPEQLHSSQSVREYLQHHGLAMRDLFGENFWVDQVDLTHESKIVVVTDVRFENEADAVQQAGGHVVRVIGPAAVEGDEDGHASEKPLPLKCIDWLVLNTERGDGFEELDEQVRGLMAALLKEGCRT